MDSSRQELLQNLAQRIQEIEARWEPQGRSSVSTGIPGLERCLPDGRLPAGSLVELLSATEGAGVWTLALRMARAACGQRKFMLVSDVQKCFYPPALLGVDLERLLVIRPAPRDAFVVADQSLRCPAIGAVIGWYAQLPTLDVRRLQLAAEAGGGLGFLLRPAGALAVPSFAAVRLLITPVVSTTARRLRVDVVRCRGGKSGRSLDLEIDDETGDVRVSSEAVTAAARARAARASG